MNHHFPDERLETRECTLRELVEAMHEAPDDTVFRWFQASVPGERGWPTPTITYRVTLGQVRRELGP